MNKTDKETLYDIYQSMSDLLREAKGVLQLEAARDIASRAISGWIDDIEGALGDHTYNDTYRSTFWMTLEELNIANNSGALAKLSDDKEDDAINNLVNEGGISKEATSKSYMEIEDEDDEDFVEAVYAVDESKNDLQRVEDQSNRVVQEPLQSRPIEKIEANSIEKPKQTADWLMQCGGVVWYE